MGIYLLYIMPSGKIGRSNRSKGLESEHHIFEISYLLFLYGCNKLGKAQTCIFLIKGQNNNRKSVICLSFSLGFKIHGFIGKNIGYGLGRNTAAPAVCIIGLMLYRIYITDIVLRSIIYIRINGHHLVKIECYFLHFFYGVKSIWNNCEYVCVRVKKIGGISVKKLFEAKGSKKIIQPCFYGKQMVLAFFINPVKGCWIIC